MLRRGKSHYNVLHTRRRVGSIVNESEEEDKGPIMKTAGVNMRRFAVNGAVPAALAFLAWLSAAEGVHAAEMRSWTDSSGTFSIRGTFEGLADGKVTLRRDNGNIVKVDLNKLSDVDKAYVTKLTTGNPFEDESPNANPFGGPAAPPSAPTPSPSPGVPTPPYGTPPFGASPFGAPPSRSFPPSATPPYGATPPTGMPPVAGPPPASMPSVDWSGVPSLSLTPTQEGWSFAPATLPPIKIAPMKRPLPLPAKQDTFEQVSGFAVNVRCNRAVISYQQGNSPASQSRLVLCNFETGNAVRPDPVPGQFAVVDLHDDGRQILARGRSMNFQDKPSTELQIWTIKGRNVIANPRWEPYAGSGDKEQGVAWAAFVGLGRVATINKAGKLAVWDLATTKPLYYLETSPDCIPALSPDEKYLTFISTGMLGVLDLGAGKVVAMCPVKGLGEQLAASDNHPGWSTWSVTMAFSPQGTRLACLASNILYVVNFTNGERICRMETRPHRDGSKLAWANEEQVFVGGVLTDVAGRVPVWAYESETMDVGGGKCWFVIDARGRVPGAIVAVVLPHDEAVAALAKAKQDPDLQILKPGTTVRLNVNSLAEQRESIAEALTAKLERNGFKIGDNGSIELVASTETGQGEQRTYRSFFGQPGQATVNVNAMISKLKFVWKGQTAWERQTSRTPGSHVSRQEGQSIEDAVRADQKHDYQFFRSTDLPEELRKPGMDLFLGASIVTPWGFQPVPKPEKPTPGSQF